MSVHSDKATTFLYCMLDWSISVLVKQQPEWSAEEGYADVEKICSFCRFFYLSAMNEAIEFVSPPVQLLFFLSKITNNCFILMYKNLCYSGEKTLVSIYVVGIIFITDYKIYKCLQIFHLLSIKKIKSSPKIFANWYCMDIWFTCTVSCVKHKCRVFRLQCAQC